MPFEDLVAGTPFGFPYYRLVAFPKLLRLARHPLDGPILEVGCGDGGSTLLLANRFPHLELHAVDADARKAAAAAKRLGRRASVAWGDVMDLDRAASTYGTVFALNALHHVPDLGKALAEIRRVLRPDGQLLLVEMAEKAFAGRTTSAHGDVHAFTAERLRGAIESAGLRLDLLVGSSVLLARATKAARE